MKKVCLSFLLIFLMLVSFGRMSFGTVSINAATPVGTSFNFDFETQIGDTAAVVTDLGLKAYGSSVTIDAGTYNTSNDFVTYIVNGKVEWDLPENNTFLVTSDLEVTALYKPTGTIAVAFMDSNQDMLGVEYVISGGTALPPNISLLSKPGYQVDSENPWSGSYVSVTEDTVLWVQYAPLSSSTYTVSVTNGSADQASYNFDEVATVTASGTGNFQYWERDGMIVSFNPSYSFTVFKDIDVEAVFDLTEPSPDPDTRAINLLNGPMIGPGAFPFIGQFNVPDGETLIEYGVIYSEYSGGVTLDTPGVTKVRSNHYNSATNEFVRGLDGMIIMGGNTVRSYMITTDGETQIETYSESNYFGDLFISEYGESGSYKYLEIYNGQGYARSLANMTIEIYYNGSSTAGSTINLTGLLPDDQIQDGETVVVSSGLNFNGNDAVVLKHEDTIIDVIGVVGNGDVFAEDLTLSRKTNVLNPNSVFDLNEWDSYPIDNYDLGSHRTTPIVPTSITITGDASVMSGSTIDLDVTYDPTSSNEDVIWISSDEAVATVDSAGVVTGVSIGNATITALSLFNHSIKDTHSVQVTVPVTYTVSFDSKGGDVIAAQTDILENDYATLPDPAPTKTDFVFDGWYTSSDGGTTLDTEWDFGTDTVTDDITLYAKWLDEFTVSFDSDGGNYTPVPVDVGDGKNISQPDPNPTKTDFVFDGWYTSSDSGVTLDSLWDFDNNTVTSDITLYAKWTEVIVGTTYTYTVDTAGQYGSYLPDGEVISSSLIIETNDGSATIVITYYRMSASTHSIFNNTSGEIRLYNGSSNDGGKLVFDIDSNYVITSIIIDVDNSTPYSIDGASGVTGDQTFDYPSGTDSFTIQNVGTSRLDISQITIEYTDSE